MCVVVVPDPFFLVPVSKLAACWKHGLKIPSSCLVTHPSIVILDGQLPCPQPKRHPADGSTPTMHLLSKKRKLADRSRMTVVENAPNSKSKCQVTLGRCDSIQFSMLSAPVLSVRSGGHCARITAASVSTSTLANGIAIAGDGRIPGLQGG